jgi:hypothetical protein
MVLKAGDYGFIGHRLKELILQADGSRGIIVFRANK